jgi:hypothetical protein
VQHQDRLLGEEKNLTLDFDSVYHVMNNTYIQSEGQRAEYIHVQEGENIQRTPGEIQ